MDGSKSLAAALGLALIGAVTASRADTIDGKKIYSERCAACHEAPVDRAPPRTLLSTRAASEIEAALTSGRMSGQAVGLSHQQLQAVARYVSGSALVPVSIASPLPVPPPVLATSTCTSPPPEVAMRPSDWNGWGRDVANSRYQPNPRLSIRDISRLKPRWVFAYPGSGAWGQPTVVGGRVYVTSRTGQIYSLDARSGCTYWMHEPGGKVRSAIAVGSLRIDGGTRYAVYFGDDHANVFALDAAAGEPLWKVNVDDFPTARITGSPTVYGGVVYVPVSSLEETLARSPKYECCKFRGSVVALDATSGAILWRTHTISEELRPYVKTSAAAQSYGPAGAAVWSAPTIDAKRKRLYVGTGNSYTEIPTRGSNAIVALDLASGRILWTSQQTTGDNYLTLCRKGGEDNCPEPLGNDADFGASPILHRWRNGKDVLIASQKSGAVYALDPDDNGKVLWSQRMGEGGIFGGIEWGTAVDRDSIFVPISDATAEGRGAPGLYALTGPDGTRRWSSEAATPNCSWGAMGCARGMSQAVTVMPGVVFAGALDGHLRAYRTSNGEILWDFDTAVAFPAVNGGVARGGSLDHGGAAIVDGMVYLNSGYVLLAGHPGNALIAFSVDGH